MALSLHHWTDEIDVLCKFPHPLLLSWHCIAHCIFSQKLAWNKKSAVREERALSSALWLLSTSLGAASVIRQGPSDYAGNGTTQSKLQYFHEVAVQGLKPVLETDTPYSLITSKMIENSVLSIVCNILFQLWPHRLTKELYLLS